MLFADKPKTEKYNESRVGGGLRYGLSSMQVSIWAIFSSKCEIFSTKGIAFKQSIEIIFIKIKTKHICSTKGWRIEMEDAHSAVIGIPDQKENVSWFAGGTKSSISFSY